MTITSPFPQITTPPQALAEVIVNEMGETLKSVAVYGKNQTTTSGLVWGYYGGRWSGFAITAATFTLTASNTNYIVVARSTGVSTCSTSTTNWNNATDYARVYKLTTNGTVVTAEEDHRSGAGGVNGPATSGTGDVSSNTSSSADGEVALFSGTAGKTIKRATGTGLAKLTSGVASVVTQTMAICIAVSDETTALTTGTGKTTFRMPFAFTLTDVRASVTTAPTGTGNLTIDINESGTTILSTKLTFDASEKTTTTAATPRVISDSSLADDAEMTVDIDAVSGTITGAGLKIYLIGWPT